MAKIGVIIEVENNEVKSINNGVITAASAEGANEVFAIFAEGDVNLNKDKVGIFGATVAVHLTAGNADLSANPDIQARALGELAKDQNFDGIIAVSSAKGRDVLARLAAFLNLPLALDCTQINFGDNSVVKSHFSGKTVATVKLSPDLLLCGIRPNVIEEKETTSDISLLEYDAKVEDPGLMKIIEIKQAGSHKVDLSEANVIVTGGRPMATVENFKILEVCADLMNGAVGASRAAVDGGFATHSMQVGQTGKTVSPKLYIGCGLSGSVQHFAGMKTSKIIVAINTDKDAPIFGKCDYGIIGDLFEVVPALTEALKNG
jgi:electron transfer flavoprotein alpha subunit